MTHESILEAIQKGFEKLDSLTIEELRVKLEEIMPRKGDLEP